LQQLKRLLRTLEESKVVAAPVKKDDKAVAVNSSKKEDKVAVAPPAKKEDKVAVAPPAKKDDKVAVAPPSKKDDKAPVKKEDKDDVPADIAETTGSQRRAIKNFKELAAAVKAVYPPNSQFPQRVAVAYLENLPIHMQFRLFRNAKVIIAQHGAGLSNLFFARNTTVGVIEISPYTTDNRLGKFTTAFPNCFEYLASAVDIKYTRVMQTGEFSDVDIPDVLRVIKRYLAP
jgi:hypothetical protein